MSNAQAQIESTIAELRARLEKIDGEIQKAMLRAAQHLAGEIRRQIASWTSKTSTAKSGALARSFRPALLNLGGGNIVAGVFSDSPYARIQDEGGTIVPKRAKALTIPITNLARRTGAQNFPGKLFVVHKPPALPILASAKRGKPGFTPQFILKRSVYIPPQHYLAKAREAGYDRAYEMILEAVGKLARREVGRG